MAGKRETKRQELKARLIAAATGLINSNGIKGLNAREITSEAGCALGSLYTVFSDLDDLVIHVNSATLHRLGKAIEAAGQGIEEPVRLLKALASGYVTFARENFPLWIALFDYSSLVGSEVPEWHKKEQAILIEHIVGPVKKLSPHLSEEETALRSRTLFAAVHGIVVISLEDRFIGITKADLEAELMRFIDQMVAGLEKGATNNTV